MSLYDGKLNIFDVVNQWHKLTMSEFGTVAIGFSLSTHLSSSISLFYHLQLYFILLHIYCCRTHTLENNHQYVRKCLVCVKSNFICSAFYFNFQHIVLDLLSPMLMALFLKNNVSISSFALDIEVNVCVKWLRNKRYKILCTSRYPFYQIEFN